MKMLGRLLRRVFPRRERVLEPQIPPPHLVGGIGPGEFLAIGDEFLGIFKSVAGLGPDERVLDVGCGVGRIARPLIGYLQEGSYEGFDIVRPMIQWCEENLGPLHSGFRFQHVDVRNRMYNPGGTLSADTFSFPFADGEFDFAFATSVFTHMFAPEVQHYLGEIARVLRPGGRMLATFFLLDQDALELIGRGKSSIGFAHSWDHGLFADTSNPELAVGYDPQWVSSAVSAAGLRLDQVHLGNWCERQRTMSYQDILLASRPLAASATPAAGRAPSAERQHAGSTPAETKDGS